MHILRVTASFAVGLLIVVVAVGPALGSHDERHPGFCGPEGGSYACGQILVILHDEAGDTIEAVVHRNGGDPSVAIAGEFGAVRDLLDPDGEADDTSGATVYVVLVEVGAEESAARRYAADAAVYAAAVDRDTIGTTTLTPRRLPRAMGVLWPSVSH